MLPPALVSHSLNFLKKSHITSGMGNKVSSLWVAQIDPKQRYVDRGNKNRGERIHWLFLKRQIPRWEVM